MSEFDSRFSVLKSALFLPADRQDFVAKAHTRDADAIILDLEDSVVPEAKAAARASIAASNKLLAEQGMLVLVRINGAELAPQDLAACVEANIQCVIVPKVESTAQINQIDALLSNLESSAGVAPGQTRLLAFIESPLGLHNAYEIASASERVIALSLGTEDFSAAVGSVANPEMLFHPCQQIVLAARAAEIQPLGFIGSIADFNDMSAFRKIIKRSRQMGFRGACCIHPSQVAVLNEEFSPSAEEISHAKSVIEVFEAALKNGQGAVAYQGQMIDEPVYIKAKAILAAGGLS